MRMSSRSLGLTLGQRVRQHVDDRVVHGLGRSKDVGFIHDDAEEDVVVQVGIALAIDGEGVAGTAAVETRSLRRGRSPQRVGASHGTANRLALNGVGRAGGAVWLVGWHVLLPFEFRQVSAGDCAGLVPPRHAVDVPEDGRVTSGDQRPAVSRDEPVSELARAREQVADLAREPRRRTAGSHPRSRRPPRGDHRVRSGRITYRRKDGTTDPLHHAGSCRCPDTKARQRAARAPWIAGSTALASSSAGSRRG